MSLNPLILTMLESGPLIGGGAGLDPHRTVIDVYVCRKPCAHRDIGSAWHGVAAFFLPIGDGLHVDTKKRRGFLLDQILLLPEKSKLMPCHGLFLPKDIKCNCTMQAFDILDFHTLAIGRLDNRVAVFQIDTFQAAAC